MEYVGPILDLPGGFAIFTAIVVICTMVMSEIWWRVMKHFPEDEEVYDPESADHFEIDKDLA